MRLGLLGPANDGSDVLARSAQFLQRDLAATRIVYLGVDGALDRLVRAWAEQLVGGSPEDAALWQRAADQCAAAAPEQIDAFLKSERARQSLAVFESLPESGARLIELLGDRVVVMIHDKARLDEDDIASATVLAFGKSREPLVKRVGSRWFLSPGPAGEFGTMLLEDREDGIHLALYDGLCREVRSERLLASAPRLSVRGAS